MNKEDSNLIQTLPIWKEKYSKMGVTPRELYLRQNKLCWLQVEEDSDKNVELYCTDGKEKAKTSCMLNPTIECVNCMADFSKNIIKNGIKNSK